MRFTYAKEDGSYFALAQDQIFKGFRYDEMQFAEINKSLGSWMVRWEDSYKDTYHFDTLIEAQNYIEKEYIRHTPHSNGRKYEL